MSMAALDFGLGLYGHSIVYEMQHSGAKLVRTNLKVKFGKDKLSVAGKLELNLREFPGCLFGVDKIEY